MQIKCHIRNKRPGMYWRKYGMHYSNPLHCDTRSHLWLFLDTSCSWLRTGDHTLEHLCIYLGSLTLLQTRREEEEREGGKGGGKSYREERSNPWTTLFSVQVYIYLFRLDQIRFFVSHSCESKNVCRQAQ